MSLREKVYAFFVLLVTIVALGFAGTADYEAQVILDQAPQVVMHSGGVIVGAAR